MSLESRVEFGTGEVCELFVCIVRDLSEYKVYKQRATRKRVLRNLGVF